MRGPVVVALTQAGAELARRIAHTMPGAEVHGLSGRVAGADVAFAQTAAHVRQLFRSGRPIVAVMATGALVRILASVVSDKSDDPPVIALAEDGAAVVPLLGGHRGANKLARDIARATGGIAAITTAGDTRFGFGLDDPPPGWSVGAGNGKAVMAAALAGQPPRLVDEAPEGVDLTWLAGLVAESSPFAVCVTDRAVALEDNTLVLHPKTLALGVGCERGADPSELAALAHRVMADSGFAPASIACIATIDLKEDEPAVLALAHAMGAPLRLFTPQALERETPRVGDPSPIVFQAVGTHSVAEAAALAAAGASAALAVTKRKSERCTAALARADGVVDVAQAGRPCGLLWIVGIGPGAADWRTPEATSAIAGASDIVGYRLYIDLLGDLADGKTRHDYDLGQERDRVEHALELAAEGRTVALVSSGDAGIYAMAALVYELIEANPTWQRLAVQVAPGISALQAAAARLGAPLGHDFCAVSLSDLLTPWPVIEKRLAAAAEGDFVTVLYNPASQRRRTQFLRALEILQSHRLPQTPVGIARNLGRNDEEVCIVPLSDVTIDMIDMLTVVVIGSSTSKELRSGGARRIYTPRGYAAKERRA